MEGHFELVLSDRTVDRFRRSQTDAQEQDGIPEERR